jgi:RHS repeat-associated protein
MASPSTAVSFGTDAPVATFGRPDPFETDLSAGALSAGIQLDLPAGPGGLTPPLHLAYNSSSVNDQHNPQGAAPWVGEGWNLGLGSISWAEHQVDLTGCQQCTAVQWEDSWQLSDPFGTAADLVPPNVNVATYNEDSGNAITPSPVTWHTAPETRARVISFQSPAPPPGLSPAPPCFRVFLVNGVMEEFGCTLDSLQYYRQTSGSTAGQPFISNWLLDLITDPAGNQVHVTYLQDMEPGFNGQPYPRDEVPASIEYDSPGCHSAQTACTGAAWAPLVRVGFEATHTVAHVSSSSCAPNGSLRCDDPADLSGSGGVAAPLVQSVYVLNDAQVQVRSSPTASWNTLRDYQFSYDQAGPSTITDPVSGTSESAAGSLLLKRLQEIGGDGATSLPARTFGYTTVTEYYEDVTKSPMPSTNCGPSWNNGQKPNINLGCVLWSQSYAGNSSYLNSVGNGLGLQESFAWQLARNNFYGMVSGSSPADPFACDNTSVQSTFPCNMPDNQTWSRAVLTQRQDATNGITSTWNYGYQVQYPLAAQECSGCVASFYWGNQNDFDELDFYNNKFFGFAQASVANPDGSVATHKFLTTQGFGIYDTSQSALVCNTPAPCHNDPYWALGNAAHGHEYELDQYDTNGTTLLKQVDTQWAAACPPPGVMGTPANPNWGTWDGSLVTELDHSNPVMVCEVHPVQADTYTYDGTGGQPVHSATSYTYDGLGRVSERVKLANATAVDSSGHGSQAILTGGVTQPVAGLVPGNSDTAMSFDGSTGFAQLPSGVFGAYPANGTSTTSYALTFEAWFQTTGGGVILGQMSGSAPPPAVPNAGGWIPSIYVDTSGRLVETLFYHAAPLNIAAGPYNDGRPHQVVATYANGVDSLYVDGQLEASQSSLNEVGYSIAGYTYDLGNGYAATYPGTPANVGWWPFNGTIGEAAVYGTALSAARVQAHFGAGSGYQAAVAADSPSAYWRLDDEAGTRSPNTIADTPGYIQNDGVTATATSANGPYLIDYPAFDDVADPSGNRYQCTFSQYDGLSWLSGPQSGLTAGALTRSTPFTGCGTAAHAYADLGTGLATSHAYDASGNQVGSADPEANAGNGAHLGCAVGGSSYSDCTAYDGTFGVLPVRATNALGQSTTTGFAGASSSPSVPTGPITSGVMGKCMDDSNDGTVRGTHVQLWDCNNSPAQNWTLMPDGTVRINGECLDITGGVTGNGTPLEIWDCAGSWNQVWQISNGMLYNPASGRCVDDPAGTSTSGTQLDIWDCYPGSFNQRWAPAAGTVADSSGHGNQATVLGSAGFGVAGLAGDGDTAMGFDGVGTYVQVPSSLFGGYPTSGTTNSYTLSVEAWFKTSSGGVILGQNGGSTGGYVPAIYVDTAGALRESLFWHSNTSGVNVAAGPYNDGRPHQVVATYANGVDSLYVDGQLKGSQTLSEASYSSGYVYQLGTGYAANWAATPSGVSWYSFDGSIGDVSIYGTALSSARVQAHFGAGGGYRASVLADSPAAFYRLDDNSGAGNALNGFGLLPLTQTDANGQTTSTGYDALGRETSTSLPGEAGGAAPSVVADAGGHGNQGSWSGGVSFGAGGLVSGSPDTAASLDGVTGSLAGPPLAPLQGGNTRSVELWFKTSSGQQQPLFDSGTTGATGQAFAFGLTQTNGVGASPPVNTPGVWLDLWFDTVYLPGLNLGDGRPHQIAVTLSGSSVNVYVDGSQPSGMVWSGGSWSASQAQPFTLPNAPNTAANPAWIGRGRWAPFGAGSTSFNGSIGEVAVYDHVLSATRVSAHLNAGSGYRAAVLADTPAAYYPLADSGPSQATKTTAYTVWCAATGSQTPCVEVDQTQRLNSTTTATSRAFYDGLGRLVETRSPAPGGQDVVRATVYDSSGRAAFQTVPYFVAAYSGAPGAAAYSTPNLGSGTQSAYDGLGRVVSTTDALGFQSTRSYSIICAPADGGGDTACYEKTLSIDGNGHQAGALTDGLGRTAYERRYTGNSQSTYQFYATARYTYDFAGNLVKIVQPDGTTTTTFGYDMAGRKTSMTDPDLGQQIYTYDDDGNPTESVDARVGAGTIFVGYDGLNRPIWRNTNNTPTGAYDTYSYDSTTGGNMGIGRLTGETFSTGSLSGSEVYTYDARGQQTNTTLTVGGASYPLGSSYDDAGDVLARTYPDGETITNSYTAQGWLSGVATSQGSTTLASSLAYTGVGGPFGEVTGASLGNGIYTYGATYDLLGRATDLKTTKTSGGAVMFDQARTFDGAGNVRTTQTTMPGATDNQSFCYDEQDRLTWASSATTTTSPCSNNNTAGTLTTAQYAQTFSYDVMGRITNGPLGTYTYGDPAHVHAATAIGTAWTTAYDAAGNMTCRAPNGAGTCTGTQTGAQLGYNNENELASWQNASTSPSAAAQFLYDGQGQRVEQSVTQSGTTTATVYVGNVEEVSTTGSTTTTTAYYYAGGTRIALSTNGTISYLATDSLGSATVTLNGSGSATASQLFAPYGAVRYNSGTMPTSYAFTGQRSDSASGLDYYGARYYDPQAGQFTSADNVLLGAGLDILGLSRYAYVDGNPENRTDPTGHCYCDVPGTGDNFFPQSGGRLLDGNTGDVYVGPSPIPVYHIYVGRPHQYAPYRPYKNSPKRSGLPVGPHSQCPVITSCLNAQSEGNGQPKGVTPMGTCSLGGCGLALSTKGGRGSLKGVGGVLALLGARGATACDTDSEECDEIAQQLELFPSRAYDRMAQYGRTPTAAQRASVPDGQEFDHDPPLVKHYYEGPGDGSLPGFNLTQAEREAYARSLDVGNAATGAAQRAQGAVMAAYSKFMKQQWGLG